MHPYNPFNIRPDFPYIFHYLYIFIAYNISFMANVILYISETKYLD